MADALSAMTMDRPYRKAMPLVQAWAEITKHSGGQFDPSILELYAPLIGTDIKDAEPGTTGTTIAIQRHDPTAAEVLEST